MSVPTNLPSVLAIAKMIDHALLHPTMTDAQLASGCALASRYQVATVCVKPCDVPQAARLLKGTDVLVCSVIGFPHGNNHTAIKVAETQLAMREGAREIDMVVHAGKVIGGDLRAVCDDIRAVNDACVAGGAILKVIFENDYLQDAHIVTLCRICSEIGVAFVKTSTGYGFVKQAGGDFNYRGATEYHLKLMREHCASSIQIKAAGGIRTLDELLRARALGATRIGASATEAILNEALKRGFPGPIPGGIERSGGAGAAVVAGY